MLIFVTRKANSVELAENLKSNDFKGERGRDVINRECAFGLSDRGRGGSRLPACILRSSSSVK